VEWKEEVGERGGWRGGGVRRPSPCRPPAHHTRSAFMRRLFGVRRLSTIVPRGAGRERGRARVVLQLCRLRRGCMQSKAPASPLSCPTSLNPYLRRRQAARARGRALGWRRGRRVGQGSYGRGYGVEGGQRERREWGADLLPPKAEAERQRPATPLLASNPTFRPRGEVDSKSADPSSKENGAGEACRGARAQGEAPRSPPTLLAGRWGRPPKVRARWAWVPSSASLTGTGRGWVPCAP